MAEILLGIRENKNISICAHFLANERYGPFNKLNIRNISDSRLLAIEQKH